MSQRHQINIIRDSRNPDADKIASAFLHAYDESPGRYILFHTDPSLVHGIEVKMRITSLAYDDNRPGSFLIKGYINLGMNILIEISGRYDAEKKTGVLEIK